jgi:cold shock CspA family protein
LIGLFPLIYSLTSQSINIFFIIWIDSPTLRVAIALNFCLSTSVILNMYSAAVSKAFTVAVVAMTGLLWIALDDDFVKMVRPVSAWVSPTTRMTRTAKSSSTSLFMFDWMNPKKNSNEKQNENESNDFFGNMFKINPPTSSTSNKEVADAVVSAATTVVESPAKEQEDEKMEKFVATASNTEESKQKQQDNEEGSVTVPVATHTVPVANSDDAIHHGRVRWFDAKKGYGFISEVDKDGKFIHPKKEYDSAIFVHQSDIVMGDPKYFRRLYEREMVDFHLNHDDKGRMRASHVTGFDGAELRSVQKQREQEESNNNSQKT